ncbi:FG-GAP-like repeat-containing protein [Candidatus Bipolaricaulota sp. J31]
MDGMFRTALAAALVLLAGWIAVGEEVLVVEGKAWAAGALAGLRYVPGEGGLVLAELAWSPAWERELPGITGADLMTSGSVFYLAGSREAEGTRRIWLGAFSPKGERIWETRVRAYWDADSHATALAKGPSGDLLLTGWYGRALALAAFSSEGWELWALSREEGDSMLGTDIATTGDSVIVAAVKWEGGRTQGILLCYGLDGSFRWESPLPGASEAMAVVAEGGNAWVLWRGDGGWAISRVGADGNAVETHPGPRDVVPLDLLVLEGRPAVAGSRGDRLVFLSPRGEVLFTFPHWDPGAVVRRAVPGRGGDVAAVGWKDERGRFALWTGRCGIPWKVTIPGRSVRALDVAPTGEGGWLVLSTDRTDGGVVSRLSHWAPPPERQGEYVSPFFPCGEGYRPAFLRVETSGLPHGAVRVSIEAYAGDDAVPSLVRTFVVEQERLEVPLEMGPCDRLRAVVRITSTCPGSPVVRRLEIALEETVSGTSAGTPPAAGPSPGGEEGNAPPAEVHTARVPEIATSTEVGLAGETVFAFRIKEGDGPWTWDFGDGTGAVGTEVRHTFARPGVYRVSATDHRGQVAKVTVAVFGLRSVRFALSMYLPGSRVACGDFDGDGHGDLVVWSDRARSLFLFVGKGDGTLEFLANRPVDLGMAWVVVRDMDGDGRADLLVGAAEEAVLLWFRGSPYGLLSPAEFVSLDVVEAVPVRTYPPRDDELILLGTDRRGRRALVRLRADGDRLKSSPVIILPEAPHGVRLTLGGIGGRLIAGRDALWVERTGSEAVAHLPAGAILALGDFDGDGMADALAQTEAGVGAFLSGGGAVPLGPPDSGTLWLVGDFLGLGTDQVVRCERTGKAVTTVLAPFRGAFEFPLAIAPDLATIFRAYPDAPAELLIVSTRGECLRISTSKS